MNLHNKVKFGVSICGHVAVKMVDACIGEVFYVFFYGVAYVLEESGFIIFPLLWYKTCICSFVGEVFSESIF